MRLVSLVCLALVVPACSPDPVDGGPCTYETLASDAVVTAIDSIGPDQYMVSVGVALTDARSAASRRASDSLEVVQVVPAATLAAGRVHVGARLPATVEVITEGTCTPVIADVPALSADD